MAEVEEQESAWAQKRAAGKARRARLRERRETMFDLLMSGYSVQQIAKATAMSVTAVRRAVSQALADRSLDAPERYARLQVARLNKALRCADVALEEGDLEAIPHFVKVVSELDRYHGLAAPARRPRPAPPARIAAPPPPLALTHTLQPSLAASPAECAREEGTV